MQVEITPIGAIKKNVSIPGSKSYTNRALALAALAEGESILRNPLWSEDTEVMRQALREFGVAIDDSSPDRFVVRGRGGKFKAASGDLYLANAGTAMRFLTSIAALAPGRTILTGDTRMQERPIEALLAGLRQLGVNAKAVNENGCPPLIVESSVISGGTAHMPGEISSQYFSSILMVAPFAHADIKLVVDGKQSSLPYIDITLAIIEAFGGQVQNEDYQTYRVASGGGYRGTTFTVEADASGASYFMIIAALTGSRITVLNLNPSSKQGDIGFCNVLEKMGCRVEKSTDAITITGPERLSATQIDMNRMPDMVQSLAVVAACAEGTTVITNVANLKLKETDRLSATVLELSRLGIQASNLGEGIQIEGGVPHGATVETYGDHRMAMAFAALGTRVPGIVIDNPDVVKKSFPTFWTVLAELGVELRYTEA